MNDGAQRLKRATTAMPLVAILRGVEASRAGETALALVDAGFRILEVPLNREGALQAIGEMRRAVPSDVIVGAGTVLSREDVRAVRDAGGELLVMPNLDSAVMAEGRSNGLALMPGILTPSEAFAACAMGAHALKLFPAEVMGPAGLKAMRAVLPSSRAKIYPVGGISPETMCAWRNAGADGFGIGSSLFTSTLSVADIASRARMFVAAWRAVEAQTGAA